MATLRSIKASRAGTASAADPYAAMLDALPAQVALLDAAGRIVAVNEAWRRAGRHSWLGDPAACIGESYLEACRAAAASSPDAAAVFAGLEQVLSGTRHTFELEYRSDAAEQRWLRLLAKSVRAPSAEGAVMMLVDVTESRLAYENAKLAAHTLRQLSKAAVASESEFRHRLDHLSRHDSLTGLANRAMLESFAQQALSSAQRQPGVCALMLIDLDRFRLLNESLGYMRVDDVLREVARRIREAVPSGGLIARLGSDEFAVMLVGVPDAAAAHARAVSICELLRRPAGAAADALGLSASIGLSCHPADGKDFGELLRTATIALRQAKRRGGNAVCAYDRDSSAESTQRLSLQREVPGAIRSAQFAIHYQPTMDLRGGRPRSIEALLRWHHPTRGLLTPDKFIELAEESGAIVELGDWVLQRACEDAMRLRKATGLPMSVAVNLSARQFERADLGAKVAQALESSGLDPASLRLELTETTVMADPEASCSILSDLAAMGISLALDDFGTGYSSLGYLQQFPLTCLKIDRSFVAGLPGNERSAAITRAVVLLGKALRMRIVAEGVENASQLDFLRTNGCDEIQGYLLAKPMPYEQALEWIAARRG